MTKQLTIGAKIRTKDGRVYQIVEFRGGDWVGQRTDAPQYNKSQRLFQDDGHYVGGDRTRDGVIGK